MKLRKLLAVTAVAATMTAAFAVNAMAEETLKLYEGTDFTYDAEKGIITLTTNKQHTTADPYTMLVVVNDEKPLETTGEIPSDTSFDDTDIKQIDQADAAFTTINVGTLAEGTYEIRLGGDGQVRWGTLTIEPESSGDDKVTIQLGEVDGESPITSSDAVKIMEHFAGIIELKGDALIAAECDGESPITSADAVKVMEHFAGIIELGTIEVPATN